MFVSSSQSNVGRPFKLGRPVQLTSSKKLLFRMDNIGNKAGGLLGKFVVNTTMVTKVGRVNDLFGPVDTPFLSVQLFEDPPEQGGTLLEETFFILMDQGNASKRKYMGRSKRNA